MIGNILMAVLAMPFLGACVAPGGGVLQEPPRLGRGEKVGVEKGEEKSVSLFGSLKSSASESSLSLKASASEKSMQNSVVQGAMNREATLQQVDDNVWRTGLNAQLAFQTITRVLSQSYVLQKVDKSALLVTTEWDKFLVEGRMFRNRMFVTVFPVSKRSTEIVIRNDVQYYEGDKKNTMNQAQWIPTADLTDEVSRVVGIIGKQGSQFARSASPSNQR
jgi:hypothetical protein